MAAFFIGLINSIIKGLGTGLAWLIALLPNSPFSSPATPPAAIHLGWITWIIDYPTMLAHLVVLLGILGLYYVVRIAGRWLKVLRE